MITDKIEKNKFLLIAGPCVIEGKDIAYNITERLLEITSKLSIPFVFKGSYRKANRTRLDSFTGIGDHEALNILGDISSKFNIPVITDIHSSNEAEMAAEYVDIIQIPAFLARQTDILVSAAATGKTQYPPYFARFKPTCPAFVCAAFLATLFASFVFATLPNNFLATFCATAKPVPYCVRRDVNFAIPPASGP